MVDFVGPLTHPLGPLPVWGWAALGGGALFLYTAHRSPGSTAAAVVNPNVATPAPPGSGGTGTGTGSGGTGTGTGSGGTGTGTGSGGTDTGAAPSITAKDLFGGGTLGDFLKGLGPNYQDFAFSSGNSSVSTQNSAQNILNEQNAEATMASTTVQQQQGYQYQLGVLGQNQGYSLASYIAQQNAALAAAGHAIPAGYQFGASGGTAAQPAPVVTPPVTVSPPPSGPQCNSGNFSCIRYACSRGNFGCADAAAPWVRGQENQIWG